MLTKQILDTLHTLNEKIVNLGDSLMKANFGRDKMQKTRMDTRQEEVAQKESRDQVNQVDQVDAQNKNQEGADNQKDNKATETL